MTIEVFAHGNYKDFLHAVIAQGGKGQVSRLAEAAGCQRSYMSDVLRREVQLTPDHADGIARFLGMTERETDYFFDLVSLARAATKPYRERLRARLKAAQLAQSRLTARVAAASEPAQRRDDRYYASWYPAAIHVATSVPGLDSVKAIAHRLHLPEAVVDATLADLVDDGFVAKVRERYRYNYERSVVHLPDSSVFSRMNHSNWRAMSASRPTQYDTEVHYSLVFALDRRDYRKVREQLLELIQAQRRAIAGSGCEDIAYFGCDLFVL